MNSIVININVITVNEKYNDEKYNNKKYITFIDFIVNQTDYIEIIYTYYLTDEDSDNDTKKRYQGNLPQKELKGKPLIYGFKLIRIYTNPYPDSRQSECF